MDDTKRPMLPIGVVAEVVGVSIQTLRLWETKGLLNPSRKGKDRYYSEEDLRRLKYIKHLLHEKKLNTYGVRELLAKEGWEVAPVDDEHAGESEGVKDFEPAPASRRVTYTPRAEMSLRGSRVLVIDDDPDYAVIIRSILEKEGCSVFSAVTGRDGLARAETERPDLIILDVMIPDIDGLDICRMIKGSPETSSIPVIIASSIPENLRVKFGVESVPADAFLMKPLRPSELLGHIHRLLA